MLYIVVSCLLVPACVLRSKVNELVAFLQHACLAIVCECGKALLSNWSFDQLMHYCYNYDNYRNSCKLEIDSSAANPYIPLPAATC